MSVISMIIISVILSVNENNASDIFKLNEVDGFLIGSASTDPNKFHSIYKQF